MGTNEPPITQSMHGLVRENLSEITIRISNGVRVAAIHSEYKSKGMRGTLWSFRKALTRARNRLRLAALEAGQVGRTQALGGPNGEVQTGAALKESAQPATKEVNQEVQGNVSKSGGHEGSDHLDKYFKRESIFSKKG
jgi:hypothetical protein